LTSFASRGRAAEPFRTVQLRELPQHTGSARPLHREDAPVIDPTSRSPSSAHTCTTLPFGWRTRPSSVGSPSGAGQAELLGELPPGGFQQLLGRPRPPLGDRPGALVLAHPERAAHVTEQHLEVAAGCPAEDQQPRAVAGRSSAHRRRFSRGAHGDADRRPGEPEGLPKAALHEPPVPRPRGSPVVNSNEPGRPGRRLGGEQDPRLLAAAHRVRVAAHDLGITAFSRAVGTRAPTTRATCPARGASRSRWRHGSARDVHPRRPRTCTRSCSNSRSR
jgi:hypothetical protein